jgi:hypothetical protein
MGIFYIPHFSNVNYLTCIHVVFVRRYLVNLAPALSTPIFTVYAKPARFLTSKCSSNSLSSGNVGCCLGHMSIFLTFKYKVAKTYHHLFYNLCLPKRYWSIFTWSLFCYITIFLIVLPYPLTKKKTNTIALSVCDVSLMLV